MKWKEKESFHRDSRGDVLAAQVQPGRPCTGRLPGLSRPAPSRALPPLERRGFNPEAISMRSHEAIAVRAPPSAPAALFGPKPSAGVDSEEI